MDVEVDKPSPPTNSESAPKDQSTVEDEAKSLSEKEDLKPCSNIVPQMDPPKRISEISLKADAFNQSKEMPREAYQKKQQIEEQKEEASKTTGDFSSPKKNILASGSNKMIDHIPCLYLPYDDGSNKLILYFHGNAEDVGLAFDMLFLIGQRLQMHVLAVEYPGYGLYKN